MNGRQVSMGGAEERRRAAGNGTDAAFAELRRQYVEGRLGLAELEERVEALYSSAGVPRPRGVTPEHPAGRSGGHGRVLRAIANAHFTTYVLVMLLLVGIWAVTGAGYFWPIWPMMGWGIGVACHLSGHSAYKARSWHGGRARADR